MEWRLRTRSLTTDDHTLVMGVVNVTPDSFSDGGLHIDPSSAVAHGLRLWDEGADAVDVGGESTRPDSKSISLDAELERVVPVVEGLASRGVVVSIDTSKPAVAEAAVEAGAEIVNDVTAMRTTGMAEICARSGVGVVLMHMLGSPRTMQNAPRYDHVVSEVRTFLAERAAAAVEAGVDRARICVDPGIGFGKTVDHNLQLLAGLSDLADLGFPVLVGASRKGFLGAILERSGHPAPASGRDPATAATTALAVASGAAIVRVHDVAAAIQVTRIADAIVRTAWEADPHALPESG